MDNSLLDVRDINHKYIVVGRNNNMEYSIIVNDVSKSFRGEMVLKNVSVKWAPLLPLS